LTEQEQACKDEKTRLKDGLDEASQREKEIARRASKLNGNLNEVKKDLADAQEARQQVRAESNKEISDITDRIHELEPQLASLESRNARLERDVASSEKENAALRDK